MRVKLQYSLTGCSKQIRFETVCKTYLLYICKFRAYTLSMAACRYAQAPVLEEKSTSQRITKKKAACKHRNQTAGNLQEPKPACTRRRLVQGACKNTSYVP